MVIAQLRALSSIYWIDGVHYIWNGGPPSRIVFVVTLLIAILSLYLIIAIAHTIFRLIQNLLKFAPEYEVCVDEEDDKVIGVSSSFAREHNLGRSGDQIVVVMPGFPLFRGKVRGKLRRKNEYGEFRVSLSQTKFRELTGTSVDDHCRSIKGLRVMSGKSLWNHPDPAIKISSRVSLILATIQFIVSFFFWWLPPHS